MKAQRRSVFVAVVSVAVVSAMVGVARATIPDSDGVIHGCYQQRTGSATSRFCVER